MNNQLKAAQSRASMLIVASVLAGCMTAACGMDTTDSGEIGSAKSAFGANSQVVTTDCADYGTPTAPDVQLDSGNIYFNPLGFSDVASYYGTPDISVGGISMSIPAFSQAAQFGTGLPTGPLLRTAFINGAMRAVGGTPATKRADGQWVFGPDPVNMPGVGGAITWQIGVVSKSTQAFNTIGGDVTCRSIRKVDPCEITQCNINQTCVRLAGGGATCQDNTPPGCTKDTDCLAGEQCEVSSGKCVAKPAPKCTKDSDCLATERCDTATGACVPKPTGPSKCVSGPDNGFICDETLNPLGPTPFSDLSNWDIDRAGRPGLVTTPTDGGKGLQIDVSSAVGYTQAFTKAVVIPAAPVGKLYQVAFKLREDLSPLVPGGPRRVPSDVYVTATPSQFASASTNAGGGTFRPSEVDQVYTFIAEANGEDQHLKIAVDCETIWGCTRRVVDISSVIVNPIDPSDVAKYNTINSDFQFGLTPWIAANCSTEVDRGGATQSASAGSATLFREWENYYGGRSQIRKPLLPVAAGTTYTVSFDYSSPTAGAVTKPHVYLEAVTKSASCVPNTYQAATESYSPSGPTVEMAPLPPVADATVKRFSYTFTINAAQAGKLSNLVIDNAGNGKNQTLVIGPVTVTSP